jgi:hypothetical protein
MGSSFTRWENSDRQWDGHAELKIPKLSQLHDFERFMFHEGQYMSLNFESTGTLSRPCLKRNEVLYLESLPSVRTPDQAEKLRNIFQKVSLS